MRYAIVIEKADLNYSAYVPDLPGCVATGQTVEDTEQRIREAIELHLEACVRMAHPFRSPKAKSSMSRSLPKVLSHRLPHVMD